MMITFIVKCEAITTEKKIVTQSLFLDPEK